MKFLILLQTQMALSAASPAFQGTLADVDCRWDVIAGAVDDRTPGESGTGVCLSMMHFKFFCILLLLEYFSHFHCHFGSRIAKTTCHFRVVQRTRL